MATAIIILFDSISVKKPKEPKILENGDDAKEALEAGKNESAMNYMKQGKLLLEDRIQMLRLADREGWTVVKLYKQNLLVRMGN